MRLLKRTLFFLVVLAIPSCSPIRKDMSFRGASASGFPKKEQWFAHQVRIEEGALVEILLPDERWVAMSDLTPDRIKQFDAKPLAPGFRAAAWPNLGTPGNQWILAWEKVDSEDPLGRYTITFDGRRVRQLLCTVPWEKPPEIPVPGPALRKIGGSAVYPLPLTEQHLIDLFGGPVTRTDYPAK